MTPHDNRFILTFNIRGVGAKDELVLKSIMRLLYERTAHVWFYTPADADLYIAGEGTPAHAEAVRITETSAAKQMLTLTSLGHRQEGVLGLPIFANELESEINLIGCRLQMLKTRQTLKTDGAQQARIAGTSNGHAVLNNADPAHRETVKLFYKLRSWPPAALLSSSARIRISTLISVTPQTLDNIQLKSGQSAELCQAFISDLVAQGLVVTVTTRTGGAAPSPTLPNAPIRPPKTSANHTGLLARIRTRFGLSSTTRP